LLKLNLPVTPEILKAISRIDRFRGQWSERPALPPERRRQLEEVARIQSTGASCRLAGLRVTDREVTAILRGEDLALRDAAEVIGYARALALPSPTSDRLLDADYLARVHAVLLGEPPESEPMSPWREEALYRESFDAEGKATGCVFPTLPPHLVREKSEELMTWLEFELRSGEQHPILVTGAFMLCLLGISPFSKANGRLARVLVPHLLVRAGYAYVPCASIEDQMEAKRDDYNRALNISQARLWTQQSNQEPWLAFFVAVLDRHRARVEARVQLERDAFEFPPLQRRILETVREHGNVDAALLIRATGANRNTLKDNLRRLVERGVLERTGQRRGARYRLAL
jgi:Fic family protein